MTFMQPTKDDFDHAQEAMLAAAREAEGERTIRNMKDLHAKGPYIAPRRLRRERINGLSFAIPKRTHDKIKKKRKAERQNRKRK